MCRWFRLFGRGDRLGPQCSSFGGSRRLVTAKSFGFRDEDGSSLPFGMPRSLRRGSLFFLSASALFVTELYSQQHSLLSDPSVRAAASAANAKLDRSMTCWRGNTPHFDGRIELGEYEDASSFAWTPQWVEAMREEISTKEDLYFQGWIKHDGKHLYLALDIQDDVFYGIETERWLPDSDPHAHVIGSRTKGRPWFGDMVEFLIYGRMIDIAQPISDVTGDGRGVQIIYNLTKSHRGGIGDPGMLPHGPNRTVENWTNNRRWVEEDIIETRTVIYPDENRYTLELRLRLQGGVEIAEDVYWSLDQPDAVVGFNLSIGDVDDERHSPGGLLRHETWWAGKRDQSEPRNKQWGMLVFTAKRKLE